MKGTKTDWSCNQFHKYAIVLSSQPLPLLTSPPTELKTKSGCLLETNIEHTGKYTEFAQTKYTGSHLKLERRLDPDVAKGV